MKRLTEEFRFDAADLTAIDDRVRVEVDEATDAAEASAFPEPLDALEGVYADPPREKPLWFRHDGAVVSTYERPEGWGTFDANRKADA